MEKVHGPEVKKKGEELDSRLQDWPGLWGNITK